MAPQNTLLFIYFLLLLSSPTLITSINIPSLLSHYPDLSTFTTLLTTTSSSSTILPSLSSRTSLTILAVPNSHLPSTTTTTTNPSLPDILRYHILLQYISLHHLPPSGTLLPTLLQTTPINITFNPSNGVVSFHPPNNSSISSNVISQIKSIPFNISILTVDSLLTPYNFDLMASQTRPPPPGLNITRALIDGHDFNVASSMLLASGVLDEFENDEHGAGITLFVPTDEAFSNLPSNVEFQSLSADKKRLVLKFHVLHSYYPLGSLESIVNPVQPTLATEENGAGSFTLNISRVNGSVAINTGLVQGVVTQTVFDQNPVAIFGVSRVLLPKEIFGSEKGNDTGPGAGPYMGSQAQPPEIGTALSPDEGGYDGGPSSRLLSPSQIWSGCGLRNPGLGSGFWVLLCIGVVFV